MAQHNHTIADQAGLAFLADLNAALEAGVTLNSGTTEPATKYAGMLWLDTSTTPPVIKQRNQDDNAWDELSSLIDAEILPSPSASGYVKRNAANTANETKTASEVGADVGPYVQAASETQAGIVEKATVGEAQAFTADKFLDGALLASAFGGANKSTGAASGYQKLPGGLILQWGSVAMLAATTTTQSFPIAFPNAILLLTASRAASTSEAVADMVCGIASSGLSQFVLSRPTTVNTSSSRTYYWFAIGY